MALPSHQRKIVTLLMPWTKKIVIPVLLVSLIFVPIVPDSWASGAL